MTKNKLVECPKCGSIFAQWNDVLQQYECLERNCNHRFSKKRIIIRPEKKDIEGIITIFGIGSADHCIGLGYNDCFDEWKKYLPSRQELLEIICDTTKCGLKDDFRDVSINCNNCGYNDIALAIFKRIEGEE